MSNNREQLNQNGAQPTRRDFVQATAAGMIGLRIAPADTLIQFGTAAENVNALEAQAVNGPFAEFWNRNDGIRNLGLPLTEPREEVDPVTGKVELVQWFERAALVKHTGKEGDAYEVELKQLGTSLALQKGYDWQKAEKPEAGRPGTPPTGFDFAREFETYWMNNGLRDNRLAADQRSLALFGWPISPPVMETNSSGDRIITQWFERCRMELHPEGNGKGRVLLGRIGAEILADRVPAGFPQYDQDPTKTKISWPDPALGEGQQIEGTNFALVNIDVPQGRTVMIDGGDAILPGIKDPKTGEDRELHSGEGEVSTLNMIIGSGVKMPLVVNAKGNFKGEVLNPNPQAPLTDIQVQALLANQYQQVLDNKPGVQTTQFVYVHLTRDGKLASEIIERNVNAMQNFIRQVKERTRVI